MNISNNKGFTLMEVVAVLIILGIVAAVAVSRVGSSNNDLVPQADIVKSHLRFAQIRALSSDDLAVWRVTFLTGSYSIFCTGAKCPASIQLPGEDSITHTFPAGVSITPLTVTYDRWGSPGAAAISLTLSQAGQTATLNVAANTGYITP